MLTIVGLLIFVAFFYGVRQINNLNNRLEKIEARFGGTKKIGCNKKSTIDKVRQLVVRIIGEESEESGFTIKSGGTIFKTSMSLNLSQALSINAFYDKKTKMVKK